MSSEEEIQQEVDALLVRLHKAMESGVRDLVSHVVKRANTERKILVAEASESTDVRFTISRMLDAVRRLDTEPNLTSVLNTLTELVAAEAGRVALFVVRDSQIRGWQLVGFGPEVGEARDMVLESSATGFLERVLKQRQPVTLPAGRPAGSADRPPSFAHLSEDQQALGVPVLIGGEVMVLVYADDANTEGRSMLSQCGEVIELLARHAGRCLEALTAERAAQCATVAATDF